MPSEHAKRKYAMVGKSPEHGQSKKAWIVPIDEYKKMDPKYYFITTGEAIVKINVLLKDLKESMKQMQNLKKIFVKTKGDSDYLETCWEDGNLLVKKKDKRSKIVEVVNEDV